MSDLTAAQVLRKYQKQCDPDGVEVQVSRQALDEVLDALEAKDAEIERLRDRNDVLEKSADINRKIMDSYGPRFDEYDDRIAKLQAVVDAAKALDPSDRSRALNFRLAQLEKDNE